MPAGVWRSMTTQDWRDLLEYIHNQLGYKTLEDYYRLSSAHVTKFIGGQRMLKQYRYSVSLAVMELFPEHRWQGWKFRLVPKGWWKDIENQRAFVDYLKSELGLSTFEDCYQLSNTHIISHRGFSLLRESKYSVVQVLKRVYPEHEWLPWKFRQIHKGWWLNRNNQQLYLRWLVKKLGYCNGEPEDDMSAFYKLTPNDIKQNDGWTLLELYGKSVFHLLQHAFPQHSWEGWRFSRLPRGFWEREASSIQPSSLKSFLESLYMQLVARLQTTNLKCDNGNSTSSPVGGATTNMDLSLWNQIPTSVLHSVDRMLSPFGGLYNALKLTYPEHKWVKRKYQPRSSHLKRQNELYLMLKQAFPKSDIQLTSTVGDNARYTMTQAHITVDIWIPDVGIGFEYQGEVHYFDTEWYGVANNIAHRDFEKAFVCATQGITLVEVPYWWPRSAVSMWATLRPYLTKKLVVPVILNDDLPNTFKLPKSIRLRDLRKGLVNEDG